MQHQHALHQCGHFVVAGFFGWAGEVDGADGYFWLDKCISFHQYYN